jgi:hypothetical protein
MKDPDSKKRSKSAGSSLKSAKPEPVEPLDILNPIVLKNIYYVTHNASDGLTKLGFGWEGGGKKKKKGKKKK